MNDTEHCPACMDTGYVIQDGVREECPMEVHDNYNLPVPVLAEPNQKPSPKAITGSLGEARDSTTPNRASEMERSDSRGGQNLSYTESACDWWDHTIFSQEANQQFEHPTYE